MRDGFPADQIKNTKANRQHRERRKQYYLPADARRCCFLVVFSIAFLAHKLLELLRRRWQRQRRGQSEAQRRLGWNFNLLISGQRPSY